MPDRLSFAGSMLAVAAWCVVLAVGGILSPVIEWADRQRGES